MLNKNDVVRIELKTGLIKGNQRVINRYGVVISSELYHSETDSVQIMLVKQGAPEVMTQVVLNNDRDCGLTNSYVDVHSIHTIRYDDVAEKMGVISEDTSVTLQARIQTIFDFI